MGWWCRRRCVGVNEGEVDEKDEWREGGRRALVIMGERGRREERCSCCHHPERKSTHYS